MRKSVKLGVALAILVAAALAGGFWILDRPEAVDTANSDDTKVLALGQELYGRECAACHGAQLEGQADWRERLPSGRLPAPPHDESGHTWHHPDALLFGMTKQGVEAFAPEGYKSDMPAFAETLSDDEIWAILAYIKSSWPEKIRQMQALRSQQYKE